MTDLCPHCGRSSTVDVPTYEPFATYLEAAFRVTGVSPAELVSDSRHKRKVVARYAAMSAVRRSASWLTYQDIGDAFNRDHTTVVHALRQADPEVAERIHQHATTTEDA